MRSRDFLGLMAIGALTAVPLLTLQPVPVRSQESARGKAAVAAATNDLDALRAAAESFEKAFNAGDAKALAALFAENAESVGEDGQIVQGRAKIEATFAETFKDYPQARIRVELSSLRQLSGDVAVEDGFSTTTLDPSEPGSRSPYTVVHVKRDGKWLMASVRDFPEELAELSAHDQLQSLAWLVGHWVDESHEGRVETEFKWTDDGNYLLQEYVVKSRWGGVMRGTQRIAWDPQRRTVRSWAFDQSGSFTEAIWTPLSDGWIVKVEGVTPDGRGVSMTRLISPSDNDSFVVNSSSVVIGQELQPDMSVRVVRRPPAPSE